MESSPLLNSQRLVVGQAESDYFALRVKGVEIDVRNHTQRARYNITRHLREVAIRELGARAVRSVVILLCRRQRRIRFG